MRPAHRFDPAWLLGPTLAFLALFYFYPLLLAAYYSLLDWDLLTPARYVGFSNYRALLSSGSFATVLGTTLLISVLSVAGSMLAGLSLALALNRPGKLVAFIRSSVFSAYVVSWVSVGLLWLWLLDADAGLVSALIQRLAPGSKGLLANVTTAPLALSAVLVWKTAGYAMVVFQSGLGSIPQSVLEAAELDGAGRVARLAHVVLPLLGPTTAFVAITSFILSFQAFDVVRVMTQGGPVRSTTVFVYSIYEQMFMDLRVGRASAEVMLFFVILLVLTALQLRISRRREAL
ncbi:MAG TPA: sugar ABC transporter permease [Polyangiaceae bacterium]|nr:sugar ABC transporter permease [Polyangiaceae bacterium]